MDGCYGRVAVVRSRTRFPRPPPRPFPAGYQTSGLRSAHGRARSSCAASEIRVDSAP